MSTNAVEARLNVLLGRPLDRRRVLRGAAALGLGVPAMARVLRTPAALGAQESASVRGQQTLAPPDAPRGSEVSLPLQLWGDPYRWLEHPDDPAVRRALEELRFFSEKVRILGVYKGHPMRGALQKH